MPARCVLCALTWSLQSISSSAIARFIHLAFFLLSLALSHALGESPVSAVRVIRSPSSYYLILLNMCSHTQYTDTTPFVVCLMLLMLSAIVVVCCVYLRTTNNCTSTCCSQNIKKLSWLCVCVCRSACVLLLLLLFSSFVLLSKVFVQAVMKIFRSVNTTLKRELNERTKKKHRTKKQKNSSK